MSAVSYCVWFIPVCFIVCIYAISFKECGLVTLFHRVTRKKVILFLGITVLYTACIFGMIAREKFIYYWDYGAFWVMSLEGVQVPLASDPFQALAGLYNSINSQEYNLLLAWLVAVPLKIVGNSYLAFILIVAVLFLIPACMLLSLMVWKINRKYQIKGLSFIRLYLIILSITVPLFPVLSGYIDVAAVLPLLLCYMLTLRIDYTRVIEWKKSFFIGILLVLVLVMRRYFGFAVVGYVFFLLVFVLFGEGVKNWKYGLVSKAVNVLVTGLTAAGFLIFFFRGFLKLSLSNHYADTYAAYRMQGMADQWMSFCLYFGIAIIFLAVCSVLGFRKHRLYFFSLPMLGSLYISLSLFYRIQDLGEQHYYITIIPVITLAVLGYEWIVYKVGTGRFWAGSRILTAAMAVLCILNFGCSLGMIQRKGNSLLLIQRTYIPKIRKDQTVLHQIEEELGSLDAQGYKGVYVLASSGILNCDILYKLNAPSFDKDYDLYTASQVDLRDGFHTGFFDADVVIDCEPLQVHLAPEDQSVITLLHSLFAENQNVNFSRSYTCVSSYTLDGGVQVNLYVKQKKLQRTQIEYVRDLFRQRYGEYPALFEDRFDAYMNEKFGVTDDS